MKSDAYTKAVLTVIAACLVWMCVNGMTPVTQAQTKPPEPSPVILVDAKGNPLYGSDGLRVNLGAKPLPVNVSNDRLGVDVRNPVLPVAVRAIQRTTAWDPIHVQVMREPPTQMPIP